MLHRVVVRTGALVGAGAVVSNDTEVPRGAMALGVPARIREDAVADGAFAVSRRGVRPQRPRYRADLQRLD